MAHRQTSSFRPCRRCSPCLPPVYLEAAISFPLAGGASNERIVNKGDNARDTMEKREASIILFAGSPWKRPPHATTAKVPREK